MRKTFCFSLFIVFLFSVTSCGLSDNQDTHPGYVRHCIRIMDRHGLYSDTPEWKARKKEFLVAADTVYDQSSFIFGARFGPYLFLYGFLLSS